MKQLGKFLMKSYMEASAAPTRLDASVVERIMDISKIQSDSRDECLYLDKFGELQIGEFKPQMIRSLCAAFKIGQHAQIIGTELRGLVCKSINNTVYLKIGNDLYKCDRIDVEEI